MDDRRIEMFLVVADQLSFSKAAEMLNITQPALSRSIQSIEAELGVTLFDRSTNRIRLTPAGIYLAEELRILRDRYNAVVSQAKSLRSGYSGQIRIGISKAQSLHGIEEILKKYQKLYPNVAVFLQSEDLRVLRSMLDNHSLDFAVGLIGDFSFIPRFSYKKIRKLPFKMGVSKNHRLANRVGDETLSLNDFKDDTFILLSENETPTGHALVRSCIKAGFWPKTIEVSDLLSVALWVEAGLGIAAFPEVSLAYDNPGLRFFSVPELDIAPDLVFVWSDSDENPSKMSFIKYLQKTIPEI